MKRELYRLELCGETSYQKTNRHCVIVYRTDRNIGRIGFVYVDSWRHSDNNCYTIPDYIQKEARALIKTDIK
ncbi:hypothetical protein KAR91_53025 [Candidatus Pacearchaeota archaeon]|nr:hypothetical protein [Candidatus Pacearchaeota archaeon]